MHITHYNPKLATKLLHEYRDALLPFAETLKKERATFKNNTPYSALWQWEDEKMLHEVTALVGKFKKPKHVILIGVGGSSLGTEAAHAVLDDDNTAQLHILDTVSAHETKAVFSYIAAVRKVQDIIVCVVSKSGKTTETLLNAEVVLGHLEQRFGKEIYGQTVFISKNRSSLRKVARQRKAHFIAMPDNVSGRYSIMTPAGLVPLALLGHDIEALLSGYGDASNDEYIKIAANQAAYLYAYQDAGAGAVQFFVFDTRLVRFAKWYRQLFAESLGKADKAGRGKNDSAVLVPVISSAVELHSTAQQFFAKKGPVYTEFFNFPDTVTDFTLSSRANITPYKKSSLEKARSALYRATLDACQAQRIPYAEYYCDENLSYSLGLLFGLKMYTVVMMAALMEVDPFDQPAIEEYKKLLDQYLKKA